MKLSRSHTIIYMLTMIAVLMLILALLNCSTEKSNNPLPRMRAKKTRGYYFVFFQETRQN
jgi:uncharacterized membrane protein YuzA (DUF378 family)